MGHIDCAICHAEYGKAKLKLESKTNEIFTLFLSGEHSALAVGKTDVKARRTYWNVFEGGLDFGFITQKPFRSPTCLRGQKRPLDRSR